MRKITSVYAQVHLFGAGLGGYLAQKFAEITFRNPMVVSLILCNSFSDTSEYSKVMLASGDYHSYLNSTSPRAITFRIAFLRCIISVKYSTNLS